MFSTKSIPIKFPEDKVPTKGVIQDILSAFFTQEWPFIDSETIQVFYQNKYTNSHCIIERPKSTSEVQVEPLKVFIKLFDESIGIDIFNHLVPSKEEEAELCYNFGLTGLGAKVYGFFQTKDGVKGRIDEFLDARNLESIDVENQLIRADIAKSMARFHTLQMRLTNDSVTAFFDAIIPGIQRFHKSVKLKTLGDDAGVQIDNLLDYDFAQKIKIIKYAMDSIKAQSSLSIHDVQFMNIMVKNNPELKESRVALIDFEMVMRNYRGFDIGGHYLHKLFKWFDEENKIVNCRGYTTEEKTHFCQIYAEEWNKAKGSSDSYQQIYKEAEYGYLLAITFEVHNVLWFINKTGQGDPLDFKALNKLFEEFIEQYRTLQLTEHDLGL